MSPQPGDPIAAIVTAAGRGAVGIVRVSGTNLAPLILALCGRPLVPRYATYLPFLDASGNPIDHGLAIHFPAPHSYTGEDVLELHGHGGMWCCSCCCNAACRPVPGNTCVWRNLANSPSARS
jgi:tRNA modification GTPase